MCSYPLSRGRGELAVRGGPGKQSFQSQGLGGAHILGWGPLAWSLLNCTHTVGAGVSLLLYSPVD